MNEYIFLRIILQNMYNELRITGDRCPALLMNIKNTNNTLIIMNTVLRAEGILTNVNFR